MAWAPKTGAKGAVGVITLSNVAYSYGGAELLSDVSHSLSDGGFYFLTGPSGAGKTTLIRLCTGELKATAGRVDVLGSDLARLDREQLSRLRRQIGVVEQECRFLDHLSLADNIALPLTVTGTRSVVSEDVEALMRWVGLWDRRDAVPAELSGGERQRAALARALVVSPKMILADEPTGNVDWEMSKRLLTLLVELNRQGTTIMIATHDLALIRAAKSMVQARVLRIQSRKLIVAGADL